MIKKYFFLLVIFHSALKINAQTDPILKGLNNINHEVLQSQLGFLSSDWMEGRRAGEKGEAISSDYIASMLQLFGVKPWGDNISATFGVNGISKTDRSYFQNFSLLKIEPGKNNSLSLVVSESDFSKKTDFTYNVDFNIRQLNSSVEIQAPVVFVGYGFRNDNLRFNDLNKLNVKGKFILKISGVPAFVTEKMSRVEINEAQQDFEKFARDEEAAGIIEINPANSNVSFPKTESFRNMSPSEYMPNPADDGIYMLPEQRNTSEIIRISVTMQTADEILKGTGNSISEYIKQADSGNLYKLNPMPGRTLIFKSDVNTSLIGVRNVLGIIEGNKTDEIIVIGAHYDHVGKNAGFIWNGADDNGSGTVGVLTIAKAITETGIKPEKTIVIALWTAEEMGLIGSEYFLGNAGNFRDNIKLNVNFDMISRYISDDKPNKAVMTYTAKNGIFRQITETNLKKYVPGLDLEYQPSDNPPGGTDHRTFVKAGIPILRIKPGHREEYHSPADEINTIDWDIMEKIVKISFADIWTLANSEW
jgi:hypothetical protein